jgi:ribonuclease BN (tRNA processing enzyme)
MALYRGREVNVQALPRSSYEPHDNVQITDKDGQSYNVPSSQVTYTEDEIKALQIETGKRFEHYNKISNSDLDKHRKENDPKVIEEKAKEAEAPKDVTIHATKASITEVKASTPTLTPVVSPVKPVETKATPVNKTAWTTK